jgi:PAS domain S-box-containing protein
MSDHLHARVLLLGAPERVGTALPVRLRELGHHVLLRDDARRALADILHRDVDVLVIEPGPDPDSGAFELCARLAGREPTRSLPVAMLIETNARLLHLRAWRAGADDILDPQMRSDELDARIQRLMRRGRRHRVLQAEHRRLRHVVDTLETAVLVVDDEGMVCEANRAAHTMLALDPDVLRIHGVTRILNAIGVPAETIERVLTVEDSVEEEVDAMVDGRERILRVRCTRLPVAEDGRATWAAILTDVTEQRERERLQADFHSMIAHDLRNPISVIQGYLQLLGGLEPGVRVDDVVERIGDKVEDVSRLLDDFLDYSMLEAGFLRLDLAPLHAEALVRDAVDDVEILAARAGVTIRTEVAPDVRAVEVNGDHHRLRQVLQNLLTNALKYGRGTGSVTLALEPCAAGLRWSVRDGGPGIADDEQSLIFERYHRARRDRDDGRGVGLGLVIVRRIVEAHGGRVGVDSQLGAGSTFWFELPRAPRASHAGDLLALR